MNDYEKIKAILDERFMQEGNFGTEFFDVEYFCDMCEAEPFNLTEEFYESIKSKCLAGNYSAASMDALLCVAWCSGVPKNILPEYVVYRYVRKYLGEKECEGKVLRHVSRYLRQSFEEE